MDKFLNRYRIRSARLQNWDYGSRGLYFVTICTKNRKKYFGDIVLAGTQDIANAETQYIANTETQYIANAETQYIANAETQYIASLHPTPIGLIARENWEQIPVHFPFAELDQFQLMPDHLHGILFFNVPCSGKWRVNKFGPQSKNLGSVIRGYKASVKKYAVINKIDFGWQPRFHDHVIRSPQELHRIRQYIRNNPA